MGQDKGPHAGEGHLRQGYLTDVPGQDHEGQRQAHRDDRGHVGGSHRALQDDENGEPDDEHDQRRRHRPGRASERGVAQGSRRTSGTESPGAQGHRHEDDHERHTVGETLLGQPGKDRLELDELGLNDPEQQRGRGGDPEGLEASDQYGAQCRDHEQGVGTRVE
jgi:hypothetical protein